MKTNNDIKFGILDLLDLPVGLITDFRVIAGRTTVLVVEATFATKGSSIHDMEYKTGRWEWIDEQGWKEL